MFEVIGKIRGIRPDFKTDRMVLELEIDEKQSAMLMYDELNNSKIRIKIGKYKEKRSLDSNAYAWVLMDKLAEKLNTSKENIYKSYIREIGGNSEIICAQNAAVDKLREAWKRNGLGWQTETMPSKLEGCTNVILYYGSSTYDKAQMGRLLDLIIEDCKLQGIDTRPPGEIERMMAQWSK